MSGLSTLTPWARVHAKVLAMHFPSPRGLTQVASRRGWG